MDSKERSVCLDTVGSKGVRPEGALGVERQASHLSAKSAILTATEDWFSLSLRRHRGMTVSQEKLFSLSLER